MSTKMTKRILIAMALLGASACNDRPKSHAGHGGAEADAPSAPVTAADPHASHAMPRPADTKTSALDPHAGHRMADAPGPVGYDLVLSSDPAPPHAKRPTRLVLDPRGPEGARVDRLAIVHEKPLHLLVVSADLSYFAHEHPERQPDGTYALAFAFPAAGDYVLFGDFTPEGAAGQIVRLPLRVEGDVPAPRPLALDDRTQAKRFGALAVELAPAEIRAGIDTVLAFTIERDGKPVVGLRPYLGAMGHCVVIDERATQMLHSHPQEHDGPVGNVVQFHTVFPAPGTYKIWGQFDVGGEMLIADFVVEVREGEPARAEPLGSHHG